MIRPDGGEQWWVKSPKGTVALRHERPAGALQAADRRVAVEAHDQPVAQAARRLECLDVTRVKKVEAAAGGHDDVAVVRAAERGEAPLLRADEPRVDRIDSIQG